MHSHIDLTNIRSLIEFDMDENKAVSNRLAGFIIARIVKVLYHVIFKLTTFKLFN